MGKTLRNICLFECLARSRVFCEGHNDADISSITRPQAFIKASEDSNEPSSPACFVEDEVHRKDESDQWMISEGVAAKKRL